MARPDPRLADPRLTDPSLGSRSLVEFDPSEQDSFEEEIYEVDVTPAPPPNGMVIQRDLTPQMAEVPAVSELRTSLAGRHREEEVVEPRRSRRLPVLLMVGSLVGLGCAGVATTVMMGVTVATTRASAPHNAEPQPPPEFDGVPVERGFRRDGFADPAVGRPGEPTP